MARPQLEIDEETVEKLAAIHCSMEEIASVCKCSVDTLERRFAEVIKSGRDQGKTSLKRKQYETAMKGSVPMLIWLGKQYLQQKDKSPEEIDAIARQPVVKLTQAERESLIKLVKVNKDKEA